MIKTPGSARKKGTPNKKTAALPGLLRHRASAPRAQVRTVYQLFLHHDRPDAEFEWTYGRKEGVPDIVPAFVKFKFWSDAQADRNRFNGLIGGARLVVVMEGNQCGDKHRR
jgi:hypothetical protein